MITKEQAMTCHVFYHLTLRNADGSGFGVRANGKCKTWKRKKNQHKFSVPVRRGLYENGYITEENCEQWSVYDPSVMERIPASVGLEQWSPWELVHDKLLDLCREEEARDWCEYNKERIRVVQ